MGDVWLWTARAVLALIVLVWVVTAFGAAMERDRRHRARVTSEPGTSPELVECIRECVEVCDAAPNR